MALDLSKVKERDLLRSQREPHWQRIRPGCFLGYRPSIREGAGTWIARAYDEDRRRYSLKALGDFGTSPARDRFTEAKKEAEAFALIVESGGKVEDKVETVGEACKRYAESDPDAAGRFRRHVYPDPVAKVKLAKLRRHHLKAWRERLEAKPALVSRRKKGPQITRQRAPSSINRDMAVLRAALNKVLAPGVPDTEAAWQEALKAIRNADRQRTLYLDRTQRRVLLREIDAEAEPFVRALCLLPLRPGAVAGLCVRDFDKRTSELTIGKDKSGKPRRILLSAAAAKLFGGHVKGRPLEAPLLARANGSAWDKETWKRPIAEAVTSAQLPTGTTAYTLRHSTITDLVIGGLPLLTVAQISDTSAEMIELHYGHLVQHAAAEALAGLSL
jgi:integrase